MRGVVAILALALAGSVALADQPAPAPAPSSPAAELVVIVRAEQPDSVSASTLEAMFLRKERRWPNGDLAIPLDYAPENADRQRFDRAVLGMSPDEIARYWLDARIRGGPTPPREVGDADLAARLVARVRGAIAYVPPSTDLRGTRVVAHVANGKVWFP